MFGASEIEPAVAETESLRTIQSKCAKIRVAGGTRWIEKVVADSLYIFVQVADELQSAKRCCTVKRQLVEQNRDSVPKRGLGCPVDRSVGSRKTPAADHNVIRYQRGLLGDR